MYACGSNHFGQLHVDSGEGQQASQPSFTQVNTTSPQDDMVGTPSGGTQGQQKEHPPGFTQVAPILHQDDMISKEPGLGSPAAFSWSCFLVGVQNGLVSYGFMNNKPNQQTVIRSEPVESVAATEKWIVGTDSRRHLWAWNRNKSQSVSVAESGNIALTDVSAGERSIMAVTDTGNIGEVVEQGDCLLFRSVALAARIRHVSCGKEHVVASSRIGTVFAWGNGSRGQLGHGGLDGCDRPTVVSALEGLTVLQVAAGGWHSVVMTDQGDIYTWGWNESGQIGFPSVNLRAEEDTRNPRKLPTPPQSTAERFEKLPNPQRQDELSAKLPAEAAEHDAVNIQPYPALLDLPGCDIDSTFIKTVSCGSRHSAALTEDGNLYTWGCNEYGQLGQGDLITRDVPTAVTYFQERNICVTNVICGAWNTAIWTSSR